MISTLIGSRWLKETKVFEILSRLRRFDDR